ncbi:MAG: putative Mg(2+) transport ATPase [Firmicutes bacterium ADurb.Bin182]|nr:MAG: putative Mg(2+) transport ATPase [Firmicutes bacterium ADurb.Bin182]
MMLEYGNTDPARLGAQVISGIGFLGAGTILITGVQRIKGLTTAACLWASACMGVALGIGFYFGALLMFFAIMFVMTLLNFVQTKYIGSCRNLHLYIIFDTLKNV